METIKAIVNIEGLVGGDDRLVTNIVVAAADSGHAID